MLERVGHVIRFNADLLAFAAAHRYVRDQRSTALTAPDDIDDAADADADAGVPF